MCSPDLGAFSLRQWDREWDLQLIDQEILWQVDDFVRGVESHAEELVHFVRVLNDAAIATKHVGFHDNDLPSSEAYWIPTGACDHRGGNMALWLKFVTIRVTGKADALLSEIDAVCIYRKMLWRVGFVSLQAR